MRQVGGYWDMVASLVLSGAVNEELFLSPGISGEMFFIYAKLQPFLKDIREKMNNPDLFKNIETVATRSKLAKKRLERVSKNVEARRKALAAKSSQA